MFLALTSDHHIPDHEHDDLLEHEDMDRRWHGCDWSTHESTNLLYYDPGVTTAELLYVKGESDAFIRLTPENIEDDGDSEEDIEEPLEKEAGVSTHEPQLTIIYNEGEPFVAEPASLMETTKSQKSLLANKSLLIEKQEQQVQKTLLQQKAQEVQQQEKQPEKQPSSPRPQSQSSSSGKKKKPNSNKRKKRGTKFFW